MLRGFYKIFPAVFLTFALLLAAGRYRYSRIYVSPGNEIGPALEYFVSLHDTSVVKGKACFITNDKALSFDFDRMAEVFQEIAGSGDGILVLYGRENDLLRKYMNLLMLRGIPGHFLKYSDLGVSELFKYGRAYVFLPGLDFAFGEDVQALIRILNICSLKGSDLQVIDFPNLFSGEKIAVPFCRIKVFGFDLPYMYGMTTGELALMINEVYLRRPVDLRIIAVTGYSRNLWYDELGLRWYLDNYGVSTMKDALMYAVREIFAKSNVLLDENYVIKAEWLDNDGLVERLNQEGIKGVIFKKVRDYGIEGVGISVVDRFDFNPVMACYRILSLVSRIYPHRFRMEDKGCKEEVFGFDMGMYIESGYDFGRFEKSLAGKLNRFLSLRSRYLIYR